MKSGRLQDNSQHYATDLAYIHDQGFTAFARGAAPGILQHLHEAGVRDGRIVDLGCGSGIWARELANTGFQVVGLDISAAMIEIARQRVPEGEFHVGSFLHFRMPPCRAVTALGEVFNYLFDAENSLQSLHELFRTIFGALTPGGLLIFDVAEPGRCAGQKQAFKEGDDWTCLVEFQHDDSPKRLTRRIVTFRRCGDVYRRHQETHRQQLFDESDITGLLERVGFQATALRSYGQYQLESKRVAFVARKPAKG
jgi:SAM-dependent methyltransferase